jgi:hypothetical protein
MLRKATALIALLATTTAVAACGGSSPKAPKTASAATQKSSGVKLAECMRSHGVPDFPDPTGGGGSAIQESANGANAAITVDGHTINVSGPAFQTAMQKCRSLQPQGPPISGAQLAKIRRGAIKMAECMRAHGVSDFPDPEVRSGPGGRGIEVQIGGGSSSGAGGQSINPRSPAFQNAQKICQPLMGGLGPTEQTSQKPGK